MVRCPKCGINLPNLKEWVLHKCNSIDFEKSDLQFKPYESSNFKISSVDLNSSFKIMIDDFTSGKHNNVCPDCKEQLDGLGGNIEHICPKTPVFQELLNLKAENSNMKNQVTKLFFDCEFTGLHQNTTLVSIGIVSDDGHHFYAELTDYDKSQVDDWLQENVIKNLLREELADGEDYYAVFCMNPYYKETDKYYTVDIHCNKDELKKELADWLSQFERIEMIGDCLAYDWVLFCEIFGGALHIPKNINYIPVDISTLMGHSEKTFYDSDFSRNKIMLLLDNKVGLDSEVNLGNRDDLVSQLIKSKIGNKSQHNALYDALVTKVCYDYINLKE